VDDYISMGDPANGNLDMGTDNFTIQAWVKTSASSSLNTILSKWSAGYQLRINNGAFQAWINDGTTHGPVYSASGFANSLWHFVALTVIRTDSMQLYVDGVANGSAFDISAYAANSISSTANFEIGRVNGIYPFNGLIDDVRIYNRALSASEVAQMYNSTKDGYLGKIKVSTGLVGYWKLDDNNALTSVIDYSGKRNNGTAYSSTATSTSVLSTSTAMIGRAMSFDGVDDYVNQSVSGFRSTDNVGTVCAWIKLNQIGVTQYVISSADEGTADYTIGPIRIDSTNKASIYQLSTGVGDLVLGDTTLTSGTWYHICSQSNGTSYSIFVNSHQEILTVSTGSNTGDWFYDTLNRDNLTIGVLKRSSGLVCLFNGIIDDVHIYNYARTAEQILQDYQRGLQGNP